MESVLLPELSVWLDEQRARAETLLCVVDRGSMMLETFVPIASHELHSSYVGAGGDAVMASHLLVVAELAPEPNSTTLAGRDLDRADDRRHCLLEHLALLREALEWHCWRAVRVDVGEGALKLADSIAGGHR
jgi:hypothetical protein